MAYRASREVMDMRITAVLAAIVVGAIGGLLIGALVGAAIPDVVLPTGVAAVVGLLAGGVGLPVWVARLVPRRG